MLVHLPDDVYAFISQLIVEGEVRGATEAIAEALRRWKRERELKLKINEGIRELDAGLAHDGEEVFARIRARIAARMSERQGYADM